LKGRLRAGLVKCAARVKTIIGNAAVCIHRKEQNAVMPGVQPSHEELVPPPT
jgi:hypothetical protein